MLSDDFAGDLIIFLFLFTDFVEYQYILLCSWFDRQQAEPLFIMHRTRKGFHIKWRQQYRELISAWGWIYVGVKYVIIGLDH